MFRKVTIIGVGLIGGSLALAIKEKKIGCQVWGFFRRKVALKLAERYKIVDKATQDLHQAVAGSDFVILATPVNSIISLGRQLKDILPCDTLITDVGSTKTKIVSVLQKLFLRYVGSHPLAGSEKRGFVNATGNLFKDKITIITPTPRSDKKAVSIIKKFWTTLGANVVTMSPQLHDRVLSQISHLPHVAVFGLLNTINDKYLKYATTGFKDTTRIGASHPELWLEIFETNKTNLLTDLNRYISWLRKYQQALQENNYERFLKYIQQASDKRKNLG